MPAAARRRRCATTSRSGCCLSRWRTPAGYRIYDERTSTGSRSSLAPSSSAAAEAVAGLATAWAAARAAPSKWLRGLVAGKIAAAENQIADLATFTAELQHAAATLERHRPDGACDAACGCVSDADDTEPVAATIHAVSLSAEPAAAGEPAITCTLSTGSMNGRHGGLAGAARSRRAPRGDRRWCPIGVRAVGPSR